MMALSAFVYDGPLSNLIMQWPSRHSNMMTLLALSVFEYDGPLGNLITQWPSWQFDYAMDLLAFEYEWSSQLWICNFPLGIEYDGHLGGLSMNGPLGSFIMQWPSQQFEYEWPSRRLNMMAFLVILLCNGPLGSLKMNGFLGFEYAMALSTLNM